MKPSCTTIQTVALSATAVLLTAVNPAFADPGEAERVVERLRAANQARADNASEAQAWQVEQDKLRLLLDATKQERARLETRIVELRASIDRREAAQTELGPEGQRLAKLEALALAQAARIDAALEALKQAALPGVVPAKATAADGAALATARARLEAAERAARDVSVELVTGEVQGQRRRVELLRVGGAAGWWCSLDGAEAGLAEVSGGRLMLEAAGSSSDVATILEACRIAKGRAPPKVVVLPVRAPKVVDEVSR